MARLNDVQSTTPNLIASATLTIETRGEGFVEITRDVGTHRPGQGARITLEGLRRFGAKAS